MVELYCTIAAIIIQWAYMSNSWSVVVAGVYTGRAKKTALGINRTGLICKRYQLHRTAELINRYSRKLCERFSEICFILSRMVASVRRIESMVLGIG